MKYTTKENAMVKREKKQVVVEKALDAIYEKHGTLSTELVIEEAKDPNHKLHRFFDWDDEVAGKKWRETQAYALIMATKFVVVLNGQQNGPPKVMGASVEVRKFVNGFHGEGFKMRNDAVNDDETRRGMVEKKIAVLKSWCRETVDLEELKELREMILGFVSKK
jgi:hypothetical protein